MASNLMAMATHLRAMATNLRAMASNLLAMASGLQMREVLVLISRVFARLQLQLPLWDL